MFADFMLLVQLRTIFKVYPTVVVPPIFVALMALGIILLKFTPVRPPSPPPPSPLLLTIKTSRLSSEHLPHLHCCNQVPVLIDFFFDQYLEPTQESG
jgi:hypothetical protein